MHFGGVDIPDPLLEANYSGKFVIFAGAGVSMSSPVNLPGFNKLVERIKRAVDPGNFLRNRNCKIVNDKDSIYTETPEQYLSFLEHEGKDVKKECSTLVNPNGNYTSLHSNLIRIFNEEQIRLVTTNFDDCFENAMDAMQRECNIYTSPAIPLGRNVTGIVHLHGEFNDLDSMVLTAEDYGDAYVSNGWSSRFLVDLFKTYTVLFVGYSCGDSLVDYLTRSISSEISGRSFVLCKDSDADDWRMRGVEPIIFDDYDVLPKIFEDWAAFSELNVTERVAKIRNICQADCMSPNDEDYIIQVLHWPNEEDRCLFTSEFCKTATKIEHFQLLEKNGFLRFLSSKKLTKQDSLLLEWLISKFTKNDTVLLQDLCTDHLYELSPIFFGQLFCKLASSDMPESVIASWLPWLESSDYLSQKQCEYYLVEIARKVQSGFLAFVAIRILLKVRITYSCSFIMENKIIPATIVTSEHYGNELIEVIRARSAAIGEQLFEYCFNQIEFAYYIQTKCWTDEKTFDAISFNRSSIEPCSQDRFCRGIEGILVNVARECVNQNYYRKAQDKCLGSKCSLLFRLGLWIKYKFDPSGNDLDFVVKNDLLSDIYIHHEVFLLIKKVFPIATNEQQHQFVEYLYSRVNEGEQNSEYACFNVCVWLQEEMNHCRELEDLFKLISQRNPEFAPREHPEFTYYMSSEFVDNNDECWLSEDDFNNDYLLKLMRNPIHPGSFATKYDRISILAREYPLIAVRNLCKLLKGDCSDDEVELKNILIKSINWGDANISSEQIFSVFKKIVADRRTCVAGVEAIRSLTIDSNNPLRLPLEQLVLLLESALPNFDELFSSKLATINSDEPEWLLMGINHPAGKYVELLAEADSAFLKERKSYNSKISECFEIVCKKLSEESDTAKSVIACIYSQINVLLKLKLCCFKDKLLYALRPDNWAFVPAWEGLSYVGTLSSEAWVATKEFWPGLFKNHHLVSKNVFEGLVRLYVWAIINQSKSEEKGLFLVAGASASKEALRSACMQLDYWMGTLSSENRLNEWDKWLVKSFMRLAEVVEGGSDTLAEYYCRWIREYPEMRNELASALSRDCQKAQTTDLFIFDGTLSNIARDEHLSCDEKAELLSFMLNHQKYLHFKSDAIDALRLIMHEQISDDNMQRLRDAATRKGLADVLLAEASESHDNTAGSAFEE